MTETVEGTKYSQTNSGEKRWPKNTHSHGAHCFQSMLGNYNRLFGALTITYFVLDVLKEQRIFFSLYVTRMPGKIVPGERKHLEGQFAT